MYIVIRAGGAGTRLWPWSRRAMPKQFEKLFSDKTMIKETVHRIFPISNDYKNLFISVNKDLLKVASEQINELPEDHFIVEPESKNTGPAICLEVAFLEKIIPQDSIVASLPSDDYIVDEKAFLDLLEASENFIINNSQYIVAPAIKPDYPEVGYSYLKAGSRLNKESEEAMFEVVDFVEKPNRDYCEQLIADGLHYWHTGMYVWRLSRIIELFEQFQPKMIEVCRKIVNDFSNDQSEARNIFSSLEKISIESAITHRVETLAMSVSNKVGWSDVGKWPAVKRLSRIDEAGNVVRGEVILNEAYDSLVYNRSNKKLVVVNGLKNLAIIETDDVLVVSDLEKTEDIKEIIKKLAQDDKEQYL